MTQLQRSAGNTAVQRLVAEAPPHLRAAGPGTELDPWQASGRLWYFDGARNDGDTPTSVDVSARPRAGGDLHWDIIEGADKVRVAGGGAAASGMSVQLTSTGKSHGQDDVLLRVAETRGPDGMEIASYTGSLGVRHPVAAVGLGVLGSDPGTGVAPAAYPLEGQAGESEQDGGQLPEDAARPTGSGDEAFGETPSNGPARAMNPTGTTHAAHATFLYETHENYLIVDDTGNAVTSFDINEKFTTAPTADAALCDWRRGAEGGLHVNGSTFFDNMQGETATHTPTPQNPQSPLSSTAVQHWNQEWRVGSVTPGEGTLIQTNVFQKYLDHAAHEGQAQL